MRERIGRIATDAAAAVGYRSAGTVEGLQVGDDYFFLEMNTRVQVEHCVTEMVTGIDIVREQIRIAAGREALDLPGGGGAARPRDRVPDQRRGRPQELRPGAGDDHQLSRARRARRPSGLRGRGGLGGDSDVRPDGRQADRLGRRPREGDGADAAGARRVRGRWPDHADPLPQGAPRHRAVGEGRDLPRPDRRPQVAEGAGARRTPRKPRPRQARRARRSPATTRSRSAASSSASR